MPLPKRTPYSALCLLIGCSILTCSATGCFARTIVVKGSFAQKGSPARCFAQQGPALGCFRQKHSAGTCSAVAKESSAEHNFKCGGSDPGVCKNLDACVVQLNGDKIFVDTARRMGK